MKKFKGDDLQLPITPELKVIKEVRHRKYRTYAYLNKKLVWITLETEAHCSGDFQTTTSTTQQMLSIDSNKVSAYHNTQHCCVSYIFCDPDIAFS